MSLRRDVEALGRDAVSWGSDAFSLGGDAVSLGREIVALGLDVLCLGLDAEAGPLSLTLMPGKEPTGLCSTTAPSLWYSAQGARQIGFASGFGLVTLLRCRM